jgi:hypothetical protein
MKIGGDYLVETAQKFVIFAQKRKKMSYCNGLNAIGDL